MRPFIVVPGRRAQQVSGIRYSGTIVAEAIAEAVWAAGGEPVVLHGPDGDPGVDAAARLQRFDGVLFPGGTDLDPRCYGQRPVAEVEEPDPHQDAFDLAMVRAAHTVGMPTLVVCRGMQVLNVALGGTLTQHLPPSNVDHLDVVHDVTVLDGTLLHGIVGRGRIEVSSYHHQAVAELGSGLRVTATADDGCVEAVEHADGRIIGVQWHPEDRHAASASDAALFADLVERATKHAADRR